VLIDIGNTWKRSEVKRKLVLQSLMELFTEKQSGRARLRTLPESQLYMVMELQKSDFGRGNKARLKPSSLERDTYQRYVLALRSNNGKIF
jgi:hypothetical protein